MIRRKRVLGIAVGALLLSTVVAAGAALGQGTGSVLDDFEGSAFEDRWWHYDDGSVFNCVVSAPGYESDHALRVSFEIGAAQFPGCGMDVMDAASWTNATGITFVWRSEQAGQVVVVVLDMADSSQTNPDSEGVTPFEALLLTSGGEWQVVVLPWSAFAKADWVGATGADAIDPGRVVDVLIMPGESQRGTLWIDDLSLASNSVQSPPSGGEDSSVVTVGGYDKFALWEGSTHLRGVNTWQRVVIPELDGLEFLGSGHVGPPYTQEDFDRLAALGANYVNISGPGLFTERPPYVLDEEVQANLDNLLEMIGRADMFAVISARTGPGRSDFTFYSDDVVGWGYANLLNDEVWREQAAQDAWVEMWRYTAARYRDNPIVVGYDLMVEPNANDVWLDVWEPDEFYAAYAGTLYDWNQLYPRIVAAIREVDPDTPILIAASSYSAVAWLPYLQPVDDARTVYTVHQYEPQDQYTHQESIPAEHTYPGVFDVNWDGVPDEFNREWLDGLLTVIDDFAARYDVPVAVNEFGVVRWIPGAADFMRDEMSLFEARGMNNAFWAYHPAWPPHREGNNAFDFLLGPDPNNTTTVVESDLLAVIRDYWSHNTLRPSNVSEWMP